MDASQLIAAALPMAIFLSQHLLKFPYFAGLRGFLALEFGYLALHLKESLAFCACFFVAMLMVLW